MVIFDGMLQSSDFRNVSIPLSLEIGYSPKNPILDKFMRFVKKGTRLRINALANATELERHLISNNDFAGIEFGDHLSVSTYEIQVQKPNSKVCVSLRT
jgi:hypothetical protein